MSLPRIFDARPGNIPPPPYLSADPADIKRWAPLLPRAPLRVGLVWYPSTLDGRALPSLATLAPLWRVPGVSFVSLQKGHGENEARASPLPLVHFGSDVRDFADTASIISQLDLVISVCTSLANLAGAMGRPCWALLEKVPCWRWRHAGAEWFPSVRQFRQHTLGDWREPVEEIAAALSSWRDRR